MTISLIGNCYFATKYFSSNMLCFKNDWFLPFRQLLVIYPKAHANYQSLLQLCNFVS